MAPLEARVLLGAGLQRRPSHRLIGPAQRAGRGFPGRDDDGGDCVAHRLADQPRRDRARFDWRLRLHPTSVQLIQPQRGVRRQRLEGRLPGQRLRHHLFRRHLDQLDAHRLAVRRAQLLRVEGRHQVFDQGRLFGRVGDGQGRDALVCGRGAGCGLGGAHLWQQDHDGGPAAHRQHSDDGGDDRDKWAPVGLLTVHSLLLRRPTNQVSPRNPVCRPLLAHIQIEPAQQRQQHVSAG